MEASQTQKKAQESFVGGQEEKRSDSRESINSRQIGTY